MHYVWMFIVGIIVGAIARFIMPGADHMGLIMTGILGIVGSFVGGFHRAAVQQERAGRCFKNSARGYRNVSRRRADRSLHL